MSYPDQMKATKAMARARLAVVMSDRERRTLMELKEILTT
jgi:hypothetical protein